MLKEEYISYLKQLDDEDFLEEVKSIVIKSHFNIHTPKWMQEILFEDLDEVRQKLMRQAVFDAYAYIELLESDIFRKSTDIPFSIDELTEAETEFISKFFKKRNLSTDTEVETKESLSDLLNLQHEEILFARVIGNSMVEANINDNDIIIIDTSAKPKNGDIILIDLKGEFIVKRLKIVNGDIYFVSENSDIPPYKADFAADFRIIGVVKYYIKSAS